MRLGADTFTRFVRGNKGSSAVEFALVAPIFFLLVFAIIEGSVYALHKQTLRYIVFEAGRDMQTGEIQKATDPATAFHTAYCGHTPRFLDCDTIQFDVRSFDSLSSLSFDPMEFDDDGTAINRRFEPGRQEQITMTRAAIRYSFITPMLQEVFQPSGAPVIVVGYSIAKNEPFGCIDEC